MRHLAHIILAAILALSWDTAVPAETSEFQPEGVAEKLIAENVANRRLIDLATNSPAASNRIVRAVFIEWLLTKNRTNIHHGGFRLRNAIITNWLDLRNVEVPSEVQLECCHFKSGVNLSGAHFLHNLSFQGSRFDANLEARGLKVDGSLMLSTRALWSSGPYDLSRKLPTPPELADFLRTNGVYESWPLLPIKFNFDEHRQLLHWDFSDDFQSPTNQFTATLRGNQFLLRQISGYRPQPDAPMKSSAELDWVPGYRSESFPLDELHQMLSNRLDVASLSAPHAIKKLTTARWPLSESSASHAESVSLSPSEGERERGEGSYVIWWQDDDYYQPPFTIYQETLFAGEVHLDGAAIGGNLEAWDTEFRKKVTFNGVSVGGNAFLDQARFLDAASFGYLRTGHDFSIDSSFFASGNIVNAYGLNIGGTLNLQWVHFSGSANFGAGHVSKDLIANYVRFPNPRHLVNFRGFNVDGSIRLRGAEFAAPVTFILAKIKGNFEAQNSVFEDDLPFDDLERLTQDSFTFNTDFGSMTVDGFAIFENTRFARSVSFRNGAFGNLHFDGVQWPDATYMRNNYTNEPFSTNLLRLEGISFRTIRDISTGPFFHSRLQLKESQTNLVQLLQNYTPYSFDIYAKLEAYFRGEGERGLANQIFISAKKREGAEAGRWGRFVNKFLRYTIMYGKWPWLAFGESLILIFLLGIFCQACMLRKDTHTTPSLPLSLLYSLGNCLPLVDLKTGDLLEIAPHKDWFRYLLAFAKVLGYILVPLWAVAWAGLVR
jgi:hypothetical protein